MLHSRTLCHTLLVSKPDVRVRHYVSWLYVCMWGDESENTWEQLVKVISHKVASPPHTDGSIIFARWRQCAPLRNIWFLWPTPLSIPKCIPIGTAIFAQLAAEGPYTLQWPFSPSKLPLHVGIWTQSNAQFLWPTRACPHPKRHLDQFSHFCRSHNRDRQTDRQTDHATPSVTIGRIYVVLRCSLKSTKA